MVEITLKNIITNKDMGYIVFKYPIEVVETMPPCYLKGFIDEYQKNPDAFNEKYKEWLTISLYPYFGTGRYKFYLPETGLTYGAEPMSEYLFYENKNKEYFLKMTVEPTHTLYINPNPSRYNVVQCKLIR